jgi:hypothetical protein
MRYVFNVRRDHRDFDARARMFGEWLTDLDMERLSSDEVAAVFRIEARVETLDQIAEIMAQPAL